MTRQQEEEQQEHRGQQLGAEKQQNQHISSSFLLNNGDKSETNNAKIIAPANAASQQTATIIRNDECGGDDDSSKQGSCSLCSEWLNESFWPGMGLFGESYILFSIGTLRPIWEILFPSCLTDHSECSENLIHSLTYSVVIGVIFGMLVIGYLSNITGRRIGSITTASLMTFGSVGITLISFIFVNNPQFLFRSMSVLLFIFGVGVGGEYPLSASSASERAMELMNLKMKQEQQHHHHSSGDDNNYVNMNTHENQQENPQRGEQKQQHRGRNIQLMFTMQGMGIFLNSLTMTALLVITGQGQVVINDADEDNDDYDFTALLSIWRITYALGSLMLSYVLVSRIQHLTESKVWADDKEKRDQLSSRKALHDESVSPTTFLEQIYAYHSHRRQTSHHNSKQKQLSQTDNNQPSSPIPLIPTSSSVSSLSAPSVMVQPSLSSGSRTPAMQHDNQNNGHLDLQHQHHQQEHNHRDHYHDLHIIKQVPSTDPIEDIQSSPMSLLLRNFGLRLFGASMSWLLWDISFYGNKLFQSSFILALTGKQTTLLEFSLAATLNSAVALGGYFVAAIVIDMPQVGRKNLQQWGFLITGSLFVTCGFTYSSLSSTSLILLYLGSSFFGQCGPNATTFLIPAEIFPTEMRTFCHGVCAASGKLGALLASILFNYMATPTTAASSQDDANYSSNASSESSQRLDMFLLSGYASFAACAITFWTIPETVGLDLYETDRKWRMTLDGRKGEYVGDANHPKYLSYYERIKLGFQR